ADAVCLNRRSKALRHEFPHASNVYPSVHVPDVILRTRNFARPSRETPQSGQNLKIESKHRVAKRMQGVHGEAAFEMLARANELERQGRKIVHLEIGEPDFDTPAPVVRA